MSDNPSKYGQPPKGGRFVPGKSGNPRGRPRKPKRHLLPRQARADILRVAEETRQVKTDKGVQTFSNMELVYRAIAQRAIAGSPTAMKLWVGLLSTALMDRMEAHGPVKLLEQCLDAEDRKHIRLHEFTEPGYDFEKLVRDLY